MWKTLLPRNQQRPITFHYPIYCQHPAQIPRVHKAKFDEERPFMGYSYVWEQYTQQNLCVGVLSFYIINIPCYIHSNEEGIESVAQKNRTGYQVTN
jgi:hypothetical protein